MTTSIKVEFFDGSISTVSQDTLDLLLREGKVTSFKRSAGWVLVGRDRVRDDRRVAYSIPERRSSVQFNFQDGA